MSPGPMTDTLSGRIALRLKDSEGFYENRLEGPGGPNRTDSGIRLKLAWTPNDRTSVDLKIEHAEFEAEGPDTAEVNAIGGPPLAAYQRHSSGFTPKLDWIVDVDCTDIIANRDTTGDMMGDTEVNAGAFCPSRDQDSQNATLKVEHELAGGTLTYIGAYQAYEYQHNFLGLDMGLASGFRARRNEEYDGISQELRFTSAESDQFDYIVGAYYEDSELNRFQHSSINLVTIFNGPGRLYMDRYEPWERDTTTLALFGQVRWHFDNDISVILGGRYADEEKDFDFERYFAEYGTNNRLTSDASRDAARGSDDLPGGPPLTAQGDRSEDEFTGAINVQWHANEDVMLYAGISQGHKTGGFSDRIENTSASFEYDPELVDSFEIGAKATWLDGALSLNAALFYMEIEGLQLAVQVPGTVPAFSVSNAADSTSQGIEVDTTFAVSSALTLGASVAYTEAEYDSFPGAECQDGQPSSVTRTTVNGVETCDLSGLPLIYAPGIQGIAVCGLPCHRRNGRLGSGRSARLHLFGRVLHRHRLSGSPADRLTFAVQCLAPAGLARRTVHDSPDWAEPDG